jgi:hypothetical protein
MKINDPKYEMHDRHGDEYINDIEEPPEIRRIITRLERRHDKEDRIQECADGEKKEQPVYIPSPILSKDKQPAPDHEYRRNYISTDINE